MTDFLLLMWKPLLACVIFTGMHACLGMHVLKRNVVFVDLSLGQIAALGATVAFLFGHDLHSPPTYWFSLTATFVGAAIFSLVRSRKEKIPQEAIIGIVYAVSAAAAVLILSRAPEGDEHIREMLVGNILLVDRHDLVKIAVLYSAVGALHFFCRRIFSLISEQPAEAYRQGRNVRGWDLLFYLSFGLVVTSSVEIAGVLLVFSFLIIPAVAAKLFSRGLVFSWAFGFAASLLGILVSYFGDYPTGASIVCAFGGGLFLLGIMRKVFKFG